MLHNDRLSFFFSRNAEIVSITHLWFEFFSLGKVHTVPEEMQFYNKRQAFGVQGEFVDTLDNTLTDLLHPSILHSLHPSIPPSAKWGGGEGSWPRRGFSESALVNVRLDVDVTSQK